MMNLRKEIANYLNRKYDLTYDPDSEVIATVGGSEAIDLAIRAIVNPGDEVLVVEPSFVCYKPIVELMHGVAVPIPTKEENKFKLTPEELQAHITEKTKMLILPYPNNPTGGIMTREDVEKIAAVLRGTNILVLSDEIYSELTYGTKHCSIASIPDMWERTIYVSGFSKAFAMTGWRLGYLCAPKPLAKQMLKIHQYAIMCAPTVSQYAAIVALQECDDEVRTASIRKEHFMSSHAFAARAWTAKHSVKNSCRKKRLRLFRAVRSAKAAKALYGFPMHIP